MNNLILYMSEQFHDIECDFWKNDNDEVFMTGYQLGSILGYKDPIRSISKLVDRNDYLKDNEFSSVVRMTTEAGIRETRVFTEDGIYEITLLSKTETAKEFRSWVRQILKGLRKGELELLQKQLEESKPKLEFYEQAINAQTNMTMLQVAKILKLQGRNKLFAFLRSENILMSKGERHNIPRQQFCDAGYFAVVIKPMLIKGEVVDIPVTLVTPRGMEYILKRWKKKNDLPQSKVI